MSKAKIINSAKILHVDGRVTDIGHKPTLSEAQKIVGGYIEFAQLPYPCTLVVNEEGHCLNLPINEQATALYRHSEIAGDAILLTGWKTVAADK